MTTPTRPAPIPVDRDWWREMQRKIDESPDIDTEGVELVRPPAAREAWAGLYATHAILRRAYPTANEPIAPLTDVACLVQLAAAAMDPAGRRLLVDILRPFIDHEARQLLLAELPAAVEYLSRRSA